MRAWPCSWGWTRPRTRSPPLHRQKNPFAPIHQARDGVNRASQVISGQVVPALKHRVLPAAKGAGAPRLLSNVVRLVPLDRSSCSPLGAPMSMFCFWPRARVRRSAGARGAAGLQAGRAIGFGHGQAGPGHGQGHCIRHQRHRGHEATEEKESAAAKVTVLVRHCAASTLSIRSSTFADDSEIGRRRNLIVGADLGIFEII